MINTCKIYRIYVWNRYFKHLLFELVCENTSQFVQLDMFF